MKSLKQKNFFWGAVMGATSLLGLKQGADANKQAEEAQEEAMEEQKRHNRAMEKAARQNPTFAAAATEKGFSVMAGVRNLAQKAGSTEIGKFGKDMWGIHGGALKKTAAMGAGFATLGYAGNRLATSLKDHDEGRDDKNKSFLKKAALTTAAVGGGIMAAKKGVLGKQAQTFMSKEGLGGKALKKAGEIANPIQYKKDEAGKAILNKSGKKTIDKLGTTMNAGFVAMPVAGYMMSKKSKSDMVENTGEQRSYGFVDSLKTINRGNFGQKLTGGISKLGSFVGMTGKGGTSAVQNTANQLAGGTSKYSRGLGKFMQKNKKTANLLATGGMIAGGLGAMSLGSKIVDKPLKAIDKDAYNMEEQ